MEINESNLKLENPLLPQSRKLECLKVWLLGKSTEIIASFQCYPPSIQPLPRLFRDTVALIPPLSLFPGLGTGLESPGRPLPAFTALEYRGDNLGTNGDKLSPKWLSFVDSG
jgi:hypothetical protein